MKVYRGEPGKPVVVFEGTKSPKPLAPKIAKLGFAWGKPTIDAIKQKLVEERAAAGEDIAALRAQINEQAMAEYKHRFQGSSRLAIAILLDVFGNEQDAQRYYMRFKQRMIEPLDANSAWSFSSLEAVACIAEIKADFDAMRIPMRMAAQEPTPVVSERSADVTWHKDR